MKNLNVLKQRRSEHGGSFANRKRRARRPLNTNNPVHLVLKSDNAIGRRSLKSNRGIVLRALGRYSKHFGIKIYEKAVCGNHIHCVVRSRSRTSMQNFCRVFAGQIAQEILRQHPYSAEELRLHHYRRKKKQEPPRHPKNRRTFWTSLVYTRIVRWGFDFRNVLNYVVRNFLETERIIPYKPRLRMVKSSTDSATVWSGLTLVYHSD